MPSGRSTALENRVNKKAIISVRKRIETIATPTFHQRI
jgi:hypothetical protein